MRKMKMEKMRKGIVVQIHKQDGNNAEPAMRVE